MEPPKLVIASVLKPVDDTRMYEKFGQSISQAKKYDVNIIGFWVKNIPAYPNITFHPIFSFQRLSLQRIFSFIPFIRCLLKLRPEILIITTHELLFASLFYKLFHSTKVVYDIRENYYANIKYLNSFPKIIRDVVAHWVRFKERLTAPFIDHFILAEVCYKHELTFTNGKCTVIENKSRMRVSNKRSKISEKINIIQILFTGTIAESTGIKECIQTTKKLHAFDDRIRLKIAGYCPSDSLLQKIKKEEQNHTFIELIGGSELVGHTIINELIVTADFGFIYYPPNQANDGCVPTKLFEYLGAQLPIITEKKPNYVELITSYTGGVFLDFSRPDYENLLSEMKGIPFYNNEPDEQLFWQSEEVKLLALINS